MLRVDGIRFRHKLPIPAGIARLVAANEQNSCAARIERIQNPIWMAFVLDAKFAHIGKIGAMYRVGVGPRKGRALFSEEINRKAHIVLRVLGQPVPPLSELVGELDFPAIKAIM